MPEEYDVVDQQGHKIGTFIPEKPVGIGIFLLFIVALFALPILPYYIMFRLGRDTWEGLPSWAQWCVYIYFGVIALSFLLAIVAFLALGGQSNASQNANAVSQGSSGNVGGTLFWYATLGIAYWYGRSKRTSLSS